MRRFLSAVLICTALTAPGRAQDASPGPELQTALTFETEHDGTSPRGWGGGPPSTISVDGDIVHGGRWSARLERTTSSTQAFTTLTKSIPVDFGGTTIVFRGFLRSENVSDFMALWMRLDGDVPNLAFSSMQSRQIKGTNEWTEYLITMPFHRDAKQLFFGVLLGGTGKVWADDLQLLVDGKPVWTAPKVERPKTPLDLDQQFDKGSGIVISDLSPTQIENLAMLGKVWGFLKYHHPAVTTGTRHWDYDLLRVLPALLGARDRQAGDRVLLDWTQRLGTPPPCDSCVTPAKRERPSACRSRLDGHGPLARSGRPAPRDSSRPFSRPAVLCVAGAEHRQPAIRSRIAVREPHLPGRGLSAPGALPVLERHRILVSLPGPAG